MLDILYVNGFLSIKYGGDIGNDEKFVSGSTNFSFEQSDFRLFRLL
jgi:hypothetical protein